MHTDSDIPISIDELAAQISAALIADNPTIITYSDIESAIETAGHDPLDASDMYQAILDGIERADVPVVESTDSPDSLVDLDAQALEAADETLRQLGLTSFSIGQRKHRLLSAAEERRLLEVYHDGRRAQAEDDPDQSAAQQIAIERRILAGKQALDTLVECNVRLVAAYANKVAAWTTHLAVDDLIQEGLIGLHRAIKRYRLDLSYRLSTYATWWIRQNIDRAVADQDRVVRLPVHLLEQIQLMNRTSRKLTITLGRSPSELEIAQALRVSVEKLRKLQQQSQYHFSLDMPVKVDGEATLGELLPDPHFIEPEEALIAIDRRETIENLHNEAGLTEREMHIIMLRFGLDNGDQRTLEAIGQELGVTRERVRQIEVKALRKLKVVAQRRNLRSYLSEL
jgi:RNA polymerase primary sigma factor